MVSSLYKLTAFLLILSVRPTYDQPDKEEELLDDPHGDRGSHWLSATEPSPAILKLSCPASLGRAGFSRKEIRESTVCSVCSTLTNLMRLNILLEFCGIFVTFQTGRQMEDWHGHKNIIEETCKFLLETFIVSILPDPLHLRSWVYTSNCFSQYKCFWLCQKFKY